MDKPELDNKAQESLQAAIEALDALVMTQQQQIDSLLVSLSSMLNALDHVLPSRTRQFENHLASHTDLQLFAQRDEQKMSYEAQLASLQALLARLKRH